MAEISLPAWDKEFVNATPLYAMLGDHGEVLGYGFCPTAAARASSATMTPICGIWAASKATASSPSPMFGAPSTSTVPVSSAETAPMFGMPRTGAATTAPLSIFGVPMAGGRPSAATGDWRDFHNISSDKAAIHKRICAAAVAARAANEPGICFRITGELAVWREVLTELVGRFPCDLYLQTHDCKTPFVPSKRIITHLAEGSIVQLNRANIATQHLAEGSVILMSIPQQPEFELLPWSSATCPSARLSTTSDASAP